VSGHDALFAAWRPRLLRFCARLLGHRHDAEEVVQDVFARLLQHDGRYDLSRDPQLLLYTMARNRCGDLRRRRRHHEPVQDLEPQAPGEPPALRAAVAALPDHEREVILLTVQEGLTYQDVSRILGCSIATVAARKYAALARLRRSLTP
jgi:RNA polymerase sigma-70 factor (ECF subfamily)